MYSFFFFNASLHISLNYFITIKNNNKKKNKSNGDYSLKEKVKKNKIQTKEMLKGPWFCRLYVDLQRQNAQVQTPGQATTKTNMKKYCF